MFNWFKNIKIYKKVILLTIFNAGILIGMWFLLYDRLNQAVSIWEKQREVEVRKSSFSQLKSYFFYDSFIYHFYNYILTKDNKHKKRFEVEVTNFTKDLKQYSSHNSITKKELDILNKIKKIVLYYRDKIELTKTLIYNQKTSKEILDQLTLEDQEPIKVFESLRKVYNDMNQQSSSDFTGVVNLINRRVLVSFIILILFVTAYSLFIIVYYVVNPIRKTTKILKNISEGEGDLTNKIDYPYKDEIGLLSNYFDLFMDKLTAIIVRIKHVLIEGQKIGELLSENSEKTSASLIEISNSIVFVNNLFKSLAENISKLSEVTDKNFESFKHLPKEIIKQGKVVKQSSNSITQLVKFIEDVAKISKEKREATSQLIERTYIGGEKIKETNNLILDISKNSEDMLEMIKIINDIATKTNLLAMNAAIEAAHAGDSGKGFAVVADEIRKLATSTATNVKSISETLNSSVEKIKLVTKLSHESRDAFLEVNNEVNEVSQAFDVVSTNMDNLSNETSSILAIVSDLQSITEEVKFDTIEMKISISESSDALKRITNASFKGLSTVEKITKTSNDMKGSVLSLAKLGSINSTNISMLNNEISSFKVKEEEKTSKVVPKDKKKIDFYEKEELKDKKVDSLVKWNSDLVTDVQSVDSQHIRLINLINELYSNMVVGKGFGVMEKILNELFDYTVIHFSYEEKLIKKLDYSGYDEHKKQHDEFTKKVLEFKEYFSKGEVNLSIEVLIFLESWLINHIKVTDKKTFTDLKDAIENINKVTKC